jgi:hypothetical protein
MQDNNLRAGLVLGLTLLVGLTIGFAVGRIFSPGSVENPFVVAAEKGVTLPRSMHQWE